MSRCGPVALQICALTCGLPVKGDEIDNQIEGDADGCTLLELQRVGHAFALHTLAVQYPTGLPFEGAAPAVLPTVSPVGRQHFIALVGCRNGRALIVDLPNRAVWVTEQDLRTSLRWHGEALHFSTDDKQIAELRDKVEYERRVSSESKLVIASVALLSIALAIAVTTYRRGRQRAGGSCAVTASQYW
ncbi:MAG TPA: cysteine peptidase family C39 domain-containing protein [Pirellulales bacterium]|nr:cysteine peptidase family C39 domain-containing protein [Pirellulales bacterium]